MAETERLLRQDLADPDRDAREKGNRKQPGIGPVIATVILMGEVAGSGMVALPRTLLGTGIFGLVYVAFFSVCCAYVASRVATCWEILSETDDQFKSEKGFVAEIRDPYPLIAQRAGEVHSKALGKIFRIITIACIVVTLYGIGCVFLLLISNFMTDLTGVLDSCTWLPIAVLLLNPLTWLRTPKDSWHIAVISLSSTAVTAVLIVYQSRKEAMDGTIKDCHLDGHANSTHPFVPRYPTPTLSGCLTAFGAVQYAYSGMSTFPTVQADMADKAKFKYSAAASYVLLITIYIPVMAAGYLTFGDCVAEDVVLMMNPGAAKSAMEVLLVCHFITTLPLMINPPNQYFENLLGVPRRSLIKRAAFRTCSMLAMLFVCASVPNFGSILDLVGGSSVTLLTFVFPTTFYLLLVKKSESRVLIKAEVVLCIGLGALFFFGGVMATYQAVLTIFVTHFRRPCYL